MVNVTNTQLLFYLGDQYQLLSDRLLTNDVNLQDRNPFEASTFGSIPKLHSPEESQAIISALQRGGYPLGRYSTDAWFTKQKPLGNFDLSNSFTNARHLKSKDLEWISPLFALTPEGQIIKTSQELALQGGLGLLASLSITHLYWSDKPDSAVFETAAYLHKYRSFCEYNLALIDRYTASSTEP